MNARARYERAQQLLGDLQRISAGCRQNLADPGEGRRGLSRLLDAGCDLADSIDELTENAPAPDVADCLAAAVELWTLAAEALVDRLRGGDDLRSYCAVRDLEQLELLRVRFDRSVLTEAERAATELLAALKQLARALDYADAGETGRDYDALKAEGDALVGRAAALVRAHAGSRFASDLSDVIRSWRIGDLLAVRSAELRF